MSSVLDHDWLGACRAAAGEVATIMRDTPRSVDRVKETGERGEGGDRTLIIDAAAEDAVFHQLEKLHSRGARFTAVSEERGSVDFGDDSVFVVVDPIDGSLNAKRGMGHYALSIAVADGPTMGDVGFGFVFDYGPGEEWSARRGEGAKLNAEALADLPPERRKDDGRLELVAVESADPRWLALASDGLLANVNRLRAIGSVAVSLCQVAEARVDGMISLSWTRSVDCAAAQFIVRESGGLVAFPGCSDPLGAPLAEIAPQSPIVAARTREGLEELAEIAAVQLSR